jgi:hypothetical protein
VEHAPQPTRTAAAKAAHLPTMPRHIRSTLPASSGAPAHHARRRSRNAKVPGR